MSAELRLCIALAAPRGPDPKVLLEDHEAILAAPEAGNTKLAAERLQRHLDDGERVLIDASQAELLVASAESGGLA